MSGTRISGPVVHPTDFTEGARVALPQALYMAALFGTELHLLHVAPADAPGPPPDRFGPDEASMERATTWVEATAGAEGVSTPPDGVAIRQKVLRGEDPSRVLLEHLEETGPGMVVMGTHGRRGLRRLVLGSVAEEVVRQARVPVLTVRRGIEGWDADGVRTITVAVDLSPMNRAALGWGAVVAAATGAELKALHVVKTPAGAVASGKTQQVYAAFEELDVPEVPFRVEVVAGRPAARIRRDVAEQGGDLVVTATHGRKGPSRLVLGSVTEEVIRRVPAPVLTAASPPDSA